MLSCGNTMMLVFIGEAEKSNLKQRKILPANSRITLPFEALIIPSIPNFDLPQNDSWRPIPKYD